MLLETSPVIRYEEIVQFNITFQNTDFFKPEICDALVSVKTTMFEPDNEDNDLEVVKNIKERRNTVINNIEIEGFIKTYQEQNAREPSIVEIYDNLDDKVDKKYIDLFIENSNRKIERDMETP